MAFFIERIRLSVYKVELSFDTSRLNEETVEQLCRQTDKLFEQEDLSCAERLHGKRVYVDKGRKQDYGRFWAALFGLKDLSGLTEQLKECFWYNGVDRENLITEFLRN